jgi:predicted ester cyclase
MSPEENKAKVRAFYEKAVNEGDLSAVDELVADGEVIHLSGGAVGRNTPSSVKQWVVAVRAAFPDIYVTVEDFLADGDKLVNRVTYRGTHRGEWIDPVWGRVAPTGKQVSWMAIAINRFEGGKSVEAWDLMDDPAMWRQLGLIPSPDPAAS